MNHLMLGLFCTIISFELFASDYQISLKAKEKLKISCPSGNIIKISENKHEITCGCPKNSVEEFNGEELTCGVLCELKIEKRPEYDYSDEPSCDQGGCGGYSGGYEPRVSGYYKVLSLYNLTSKKRIYDETIYSPRQSELDMLLNEANELASKKCSKVINRIVE
jgi:hypothetical protein